MKEQCTANGIEYTSEVIDDYVIADSSYGNEYVFEYNNIAAKEMNNKIYAVLYAEYNFNGLTAISPMDEYSISKYAYNKLGKSSTKQALKVLQVDMLNYGAAAQNYFGYNTANLVNASLTAQQKALGTDPSTMNIKSDASESIISSPKAKFTGNNLLLGNNVAIVYYMTFDSSVNKNNVTLELSYITVLGEKKTESIPFSQMKLSGYAADEYEYDFLSVRAKDSCRPVTAKICENGRQISNANTYSTQTYAYNKLNKNTTSQKLRTIINALMVYCKSAENYFSK